MVNGLAWLGLRQEVSRAFTSRQYRETRRGGQNERPES